MENYSQSFDTDITAVDISRLPKQHVKSKWDNFKSCVYTSRNLLGALIARVLFLIAAVAFTTISVSSAKSNIVYCLYLPLVLMVLETITMFKYRQNTEWKWGTPSIFLFLLCSVPSIWILEVDSTLRHLEELRNISSEIICEVNDSIDSLVKGTNLSVSSAMRLGNRVHDMCVCSDCIPKMVQILLLILIVGRWLLPKSKSISADQKAQLLLVNIAVAADILELFELLKEDKVRNEFGLVFAVLMVWSCSLLQFGVVSTATSEKGWMCFRSEMWALITLLCLDDLPFLILRVVCMAGFGVISYNSYFFTAKNGLVLMLDLNRIHAVYHEMKKNEKELPEGKQSVRVIHIRR